MKALSQLVIALAIAAGASDVAQAQSPRATSSLSKARDVAGITTTTSATDAVNKLRASGWTVTRDSGVTWQQHVGNEKARLTGSGRGNYAQAANLGDIYGQKGTERVAILVRPSPTGGKIMRVAYNSPRGGRPISDLINSLNTKYGVPTSGSASATGFNVRWCTSKATCRNGAMRDPYLTASASVTSEKLEITLFNGLDEALAYDRMVGSATGAAPKTNSF